MGRDPFVLAEDTGEIALIVKAYGGRDLHDGHFGIRHQMAGLTDPQLIQIVCERHADLLPE